MGPSPPFMKPAKKYIRLITPYNERRLLRVGFFFSINHLTVKIF